MKGLVARAKKSRALRRVLMPLLVRFPALPRRLFGLTQRFAGDIAHADWPSPLPAAYLHLPVPTRKVLLDLAGATQYPSPLTVARDRARLAWVAPRLPDQEETRLLDALARHYAIDLIVPDVEVGADTPIGLPLHDGAWFAQHHGQFTRVLYHVANSAEHGPVLDLLARHPGIVVLHDFFLGDAVSGLPQTLFHAHGYSGLLAWRSHGNAATLATFPLNRIVFDQATGIIVDADVIGTMRALVQAWYGPRGVDDMHPAGNYAAAIENILENSAAARYRHALRNQAADGLPSDPRSRSLIAAAQALAASQPAWAPRQLLVDISFLVADDLKTGIQRVVRSILLAMLKNPPAGLRVEPVYGNGVRPGYRYARRFTLTLLGFDGIAGDDDPVAHQAGDIFLGLDLAKSSTMNNLDTLADMRSRGVAIHFVMYDILPLLQPDAFPYGAAQHFKQYVLAIARHADGVACISRAVADELCAWLTGHGGPRATPLRIAHFHLGADLDASAPSVGMSADANQVLAAMGGGRRS